MLAVDEELGGHGRALLAGGRLVREELHRRVRVEVLALEGGPDLGRRDLGAGVLGDRLDRLGELDLQPPGQVEAVLGLHQVGDAALAALAVDPDRRPRRCGRRASGRWAGTARPTPRSRRSRAPRSPS